MATPVCTNCGYYCGCEPAAPPPDAAGGTPRCAHCGLPGHTFADAEHHCPDTPAVPQPNVCLTCGHAPEVHGRYGAPCFGDVKCSCVLFNPMPPADTPQEPPRFTAERWSMTYGDLPDAVARLIEPHIWDNKNISEQRDWAVAELQRLAAAQRLAGEK